MSITDGMPHPFTLTLRQDRERVWDNLPITFTAIPNNEGPFIYYWYLNGELLEDEDGETLELETSLPHGKHFVGVTASRKGVLASVLTSFLIIDEPSTYFTIKLFEKDTDNLGRQFNLDYTIPDFMGIYDGEYPFVELDFRPLEVKTVVLQLGEEIIYKEFFVNALNRVYREEDSVFDVIFDDITHAAIAIFDFDEEGGYQLTESQDGRLSAMFGLSTSQIEVDGKPGIGQLLSYYIEGTGVVNITEFGDIGGFVKGDIEIKDVPMFYYDKEAARFDPYYINPEGYDDLDVEVEFLLSRGEDIIVPREVIKFVFENNDETNLVIIIGKIYESLLRDVAIDYMSEFYGAGEIAGWSTEGHDGEMTYSLYDSIVGPESELTLYAVWDYDD